LARKKIKKGKWLKVDDSGREFKKRWAGQYFFVQVKNKPICYETLVKRLAKQLWSFTQKTQKRLDTPARS